VEGRKKWIGEERRRVKGMGEKGREGRERDPNDLLK